MASIKKAMLGMAAATIAVGGIAGDAMPYMPDYPPKATYSERRAKTPKGGNAEYYVDDKGNIRRRKHEQSKAD